MQIARPGPILNSHSISIAPFTRVPSGSLDEDDPPIYRALNTTTGQTMAPRAPVLTHEHDGRTHSTNIRAGNNANDTSSSLSKKHLPLFQQYGYAKDPGLSRGDETRQRQLPRTSTPPKRPQAINRPRAKCRLPHLSHLPLPISRLASRERKRASEIPRDANKDTRETWVTKVRK